MMHIKVSAQKLYCCAVVFILSLSAWTGVLANTAPEDLFVYPVNDEQKVTDQTLTGPEHDEFGKDVAVHGAYALIAKKEYAVGYTRQADGSWDTLQYEVTAPPDTQQVKSSVFFGGSVEVNGDVAIIGDINAYVGNVYGGYYSCGAAHIYSLGQDPSDPWELEQSIPNPDCVWHYTTFQGFGFGLAIEGNTAVITSTTTEVNGAIYAGTVYIYEKNATTGVWEKVAQFSGGDLNEQLGMSVALKGDMLLVGAGNVNQTTRRYEGGVYVFRRIGGLWGLDTIINNPVPASLGNGFGMAVATDGTQAVFGAPKEGSTTPRGAAYFYHWDEGTSQWVFDQKLAGSLTNWYDRFGSSVAVEGEYAVIGSPGERIGSIQEVGAIYIFHHGPNGWHEQELIQPSDALVGIQFGSSAALSGGAILAGAPTSTYSGSQPTGSAYFYETLPFTFDEPQNGSSVATLSALDSDPGETFTYAFAEGGDAEGRFEIGGAVGNEILVKDGSRIQAADGSYDVTVQVTDSASNVFTRTFGIKVFE